MCICTVVYPMIYPQSQSLEHHAGIRRCSGSWTFRAPGCVWPQRRKHRPSRNKKLQRLITQLWGIGGIGWILFGGLMGIGWILFGDLTWLNMIQWKIESICHVYGVSGSPESLMRLENGILNGLGGNCSPVIPQWPSRLVNDFNSSCFGDDLSKHKVVNDSSTPFDD